MNILKFFKTKNTIKSELFNNNTDTKNSKIALEILLTLDSFYNQLIKTEANKKLKNDPKWKFEKAIIIFYFYHRVYIETSILTFDEELFEYLYEKVEEWTSYVYKKEFKLIKNDGENVDIEINRFDVYDSLLPEKYDFNINLLNRKFLEYSTYIQYYGFGEFEINDELILSKSLDFDDWINSFHKTKIDFETLLIPGFTKIKEYLEEL